MSAPIIITVPSNYMTGPEVAMVQDETTPSRKRRLDHLSWEEKMQRKKLKNRVAAQTSRDRKKAKMDEMEDRIKLLEDRNDLLTSEVASLKALNERLLSENTLLKSGAARDVGGEASGPAESDPRQQEATPPALRAARLLLVMCLLSQTYSHSLMPMNTSKLCKTLQTPSSKKLIQALQERLQMSKSTTLDSVLQQLKWWWGPQQSTWNPLKA